MSYAYTIPTCRRCGDEYQPRDEDDPGDLCDPCAQDEVARLRRRVATLEQRLARVLSAATWAHNVHAGEGFRSVPRPYGCVWSRRRSGRGTR